MKRKHVSILYSLVILAGIYGCGGGGGGGDVTVGSGATSGQAVALNANSQLCASCDTSTVSGVGLLTSMLQGIYQPGLIPTIVESTPITP